jgi:hypothetical protein
MRPCHRHEVRRFWFSATDEARRLGPYRLDSASCAAQGDNSMESTPGPTTVENFRRAETDTYFGATVKKGGFGTFDHNREPVPIDQQTVLPTVRR